MALHTYLPEDRLHALARGEGLPERTSGAVLVADINGFTPLTEALVQALGERQGVETLSRQVNAVYEALIDQSRRHGGSVVGFAGDAVTCWFDGGDAEAERRAASCALAMQQALRAFAPLAVKVAVCAGPARRWAVGDPAIQTLDVLAGATVARALRAEALAAPGEVLVDAATARAIALAAAPGADGFHRLDPAWGPQAPGLPPRPGPLPGPEQLRPWVLPFVFEREAAGDELFATDLRPATALFLRVAGAAADDAAAAALAALVAPAQRVLQRHGGVLLELTLDGQGAGLYASFGAARVHEDDPQRALRAALALRALCPPGTAQIGLSSGTMRVGGYGSSLRRSFGAIGDDVNTAARLMRLAQPGEILVSGRMRAAVESEFELEPRPPVPVKGKAEPLPVFAVAGLRQRRPIRLQEPVHALPLVGRQAETGLLAQAFAAARDGRGRVLALVAEAGMGKSRLVAEAIRMARHEGFIGYGGACQADGRHTPYGPWQALWSAFFDLDPALPQRRQRQAVQAALQRLAPVHAEAWPLLGEVLGQDWPDEDFTRALQPADRKALRETVLLRCLGAAAQEAAEDGMGLLLVLEDLHAADPLSLDLLQRVAQAITALPVLLLLSCRPPEGEAPAATARLAALPHFEALALGGLAAAQTEQLIRAQLALLFPQRTGAVPPALIERITARAQGNPFYAEELLAYLHDRGLDPRDAAAIEAPDLPASLHSLVLSRLDRLPAAQQRVTKAASIIGRHFELEPLQGYCPTLGAPEAVQADLEALARAGFTPRAEPGPGHLFRHLVTLEASYASLADDARTRLHGQYAQYLERQQAGSAATLAHHFVRAGLREPAVRCLQLAGAQAAARFANDEALACYGQALAWLPDDAVETRFDLLLRREAVHDLQGRHEASRHDLAALDRLHPALADPAWGRARIEARRAKLGIEVGDYAAARRAAQAAAVALDAAAPGPADELRVDVLLLEARAMFYAGDTAGGSTVLEQALERSRAQGYRRGEYLTLSQMGLRLWQAGAYEAAERRLAEALQGACAAGDARPQINILNNLGVVANARARPAQAGHHYEQAQQLARRIGDRSGEAMLLNNMASACMAAGDFHAAGQHAAAAERLYAELEEPAERSLALVNRAEAHRELGQYTQARALAVEAVAMLRASGLRRGLAAVLENLGLIELALGRPAAALRDFDEALGIAREIGLRALEGSVLHRLGRAHLSLGHLAPARAALDEAAALLQALGAEPSWLAVQATQAERLLAEGRDADALRACLEPVLQALLAPAVPGAPLLPMGLYGSAHRVLVAAGDGRAAAVRQRAREELAARGERIPDPSARRDFLAVDEHRVLAGD